MSMRKKIAHVVWQNENCVGFSVARVLWARTFEAFSKDGCEAITAYRTADAILAALPDMIAPLVWENEDDEYQSAQSILGQFTVYLCSEHGYLIEIDGYDDSWVKYPEGGYGFNTPEQAQAAANTHHRAAIMAAFTGETQ
jgi:hypothetical protein